MQACHCDAGLLDSDEVRAQVTAIATPWYPNFAQFQFHLCTMRTRHTASASLLTSHTELGHGCVDQRDAHGISPWFTSESDHALVDVLLGPVHNSGGRDPGMPALLRRMMAFEPFGALVANWWMLPPPLGRPHPRMFVGTTISALCPKFNDRVVPTCLTGPSNWFSPPASACTEFAGILCKGR